MLELQDLIFIFKNLIPFFKLHHPQKEMLILKKSFIKMLY